MKTLICHSFRTLILRTMLTIVVGVCGRILADTPPENGPGPVGSSISFSADQFTGQFGYSVPIIVPPGRQGAEPKLALSYKSGGGNGWCGVGWSLDTGRIERQTKFGVPIKWSGANPLSEYDDAKGFVINFGGHGGNLIAIGSDQYRLETEGDFLIITFVRASNYWEVHDKGGNKFYFGESTGSRIENTRWTGSTDKTTFTWALNRVQDVNGNKMDITYTKDTGILYPDVISYNGNVNTPALSTTHTVKFNLETRTDQQINYRGGFRAQLKSRLHSIDTKVSGQLARSYGLGYGAVSPSTTRSVLRTVTMFGKDGTTAAPATTFGYQEKVFEFGPLESRGPLDPYESGSIDSTETSMPSSAYVQLVDFDGDGRPDRVFLKTTVTPDPNAQGGETESNTWYFQRNNGAGFDAAVVIPGYSPHYWSLWGTDHRLSAYDNRGFTTYNDLGAPRIYRSMLADMDGDGRIDRVSGDSLNISSFTVAKNTGGALASPVSWSGVDSQGTGLEQFAAILRNTFSGTFRSFSTFTSVRLVDINGDGKPDRVMMPADDITYSTYKVQLNTGSGFGPVLNWPGVQPEYPQWDWATLESATTSGTVYVTFADLNGDGLPDRIMSEAANPYDQFSVQFNNGSGFDPKEYWGPVDSQGDINNFGWGSISAAGLQYVGLLDINGDGLVDRVMRMHGAPYSALFVQLNTGTGFTTPPIQMGPLLGATSNLDFWNAVSAADQGRGYVRMADINGDGLVDRVLAQFSAPYTALNVQTNKGPFPDLLCSVDNGIGGKVTIEYVPSTTCVNTDSNGKNLLPFVMNLVTNIYVDDGVGTPARYTYKYSGGYFDGIKKQFRGFACVEATDPSGTKTKTFFHQDGGYDYSASGEFGDTASHSKVGIPFRIDRYGSDGLPYSSILNKVEEVQVNAAGVWFPYVSTTITVEFPGGNQSTYRATAQTMTYDNTTGNILSAQNWGEVTSINQTNYTFADVNAQNVWTLTSYATFVNTDIRNKPSSIVTSSTSLATGRLRETQFFYDTRGNLLTNQVWLDRTDAFQSGAIGFVPVMRMKYDAYGNPTEVVDKLNVTNIVTYDSTYQTFAMQVDHRSLDNATTIFTTKTFFDPLAGVTTGTIDPNGVVITNFFDKLFRPTENWVNSTAYAPATPSLWRAKIDYNLGGVANGVSANYVRTRLFDGTDLVNGTETYTYSDGVGKVIQTRVESETNNWYRVVDQFHDSAGRAILKINPYFSQGTTFTGPSGTKVAAYTQFDPIGRPSTATPAVNVSFASWAPTISAVTQDSGSPTGPSTIAYFEGTNPWVTVGTDSESKVTKTYRDEFGRPFHVAQILSGANVDTWFYYDRLGNLTGMYDPALKWSSFVYNSLGWKLEQLDPNMGDWIYYYDNQGRLLKQEDSELQDIVFEYNDYFGRQSAKKCYNGSQVLVSTSTYSYDTPVYVGHDVFKGQVARVTDAEGQQYYGYDFKGHMLKSTRYLSKNAKYYTTTTVYNDADQIATVVYPSSIAAELNYTYVNNVLTKIASNKGTGASQEIFYQLVSMDEFGKAVKWNTHNNTAINTMGFFPVSRRVQQVQTTKNSTNIQSVSYTFDKVSNFKTITDGVHTGTGSGSISGATYDDLHRLTGLTYVGTSQARTFSYSTTGNLLVNGDFGAGTYTYSAGHPNAVTSANGKTYSYNYNGDMVNRNGQLLTYTPERHLSTITGTGINLAFGYDDAGVRLWKQNVTSGALTCWIGDSFEDRGTVQLCHVFADGIRIATFQPVSGGPYAFNGRDESLRMFAKTTGQAVGRSIEWAFQDGRSGITALISISLMLFALTVFLKIRHGASVLRIDGRNVLRSRWYHKTVAYVSAVAIVFTATNTNVHAVSVNPVFLYYIKDHLGSSTITTDRTGVVAHHYEYNAYGTTRVSQNDSVPLFEISNRYTDQALDAESGLYFYHARYYDPELGQFTQPDSVVADPGTSQSLNRYAYVHGNPLKYNDPTGHVIGIDDLIIAVVIGVVVGAAAGAAVAAATGGDPGMGALTGAIAGAFSVVPYVGGVIAGTINAAITGQDVGMGALMGVIGTAVSMGVGAINNAVLGGALSDTVVTVGSGAISGGIGAELRGGDFGDGAANGAIGATISASVKSVPGIVRALAGPWESGKDNPKSNLDRQPRQSAQNVRAARALDPERHNDPDRAFALNGMHGLHAGSNAANVASFGPGAAPLQWLMGLFHETPFDSNSWKGEYLAQGAFNRSLDGFGDIVANTWGIAVGLVFSHDFAMRFAAATGNYIPGPGRAAPYADQDTQQRLGTSPSDYWGPYPKFPWEK